MQFQNGNNHHSRHQSDFSDSHFSDSLRSFRDQDRDRDRRPQGKKFKGDKGNQHHKQEPSGHRQFRHIDRQHGAVRFCSRSEGACAMLLERYVPDFRLKEGVNFQIPIGQNHRGHTLTVDFMINGVLVEYHAVRFWRNSKSWGDFKDYDEYRDYRKALATLPKHERKEFEEQTKLKLAQNYYEKRREALNQHAEFKDVELIVAISPGDFFDQVMLRFGKGFPRNKGEFNKQFEKCLKEVVADYETPKCDKGEKKERRKGRRSKDRD